MSLSSFGLFLAAGIIARLLIAGEASMYVTGQMRAMLWISLPVLVTLGIAMLRPAHEHRRGLVLLIVPALIAVSGVKPITFVTEIDDEPRQALPIQWTDPGQFDPTVTPTTRNTPTGPPPKGGWPEVEDGQEVDIYAVSARMDQDAAETIVGKKIVTTGYASGDPDRPGEAMLVRNKVWCCAADGLPFAVTILGADVQPGQWYEATGTILPPAGNGDAAMQVDEITEVEQPALPYIE